MTKPPDQPHGTPFHGGRVRQRGFLGALFDCNFDRLVTPKLIKLCYGVALLLISLHCTVFLGLGLWIAGWEDYWAWGLIMVAASPLVWVFEATLARILLESIVVRFRGVEHLRVIAGTGPGGRAH